MVLIHKLILFCKLLVCSSYIPVTFRHYLSSFIFGRMMKIIMTYSNLPDSQMITLVSTLMASHSRIPKFMRPPPTKRRIKSSNPRRNYSRTGMRPGMFRRIICFGKFVSRVRSDVRRQRPTGCDKVFS